MSKHYKICFVGLGSIARRHIVNIRQVIEERGGSCEIDILRSGHGKDIPDDLRPLIDSVYYSAADLQEYYDIVFVTNPTARHFETIRTLKDIGKTFFVEKPLVHTSGITAEELGLEDKVCYVACPLRYTGVIEYLKRNIDFEAVRSMRVVSASYLPEWRPETDYRDTYSAKKELGGGVSIDLIHEWDYITYLMGMPRSVSSVIKKVSDLEIDSDDIAVYIADYGSCVLELHLDYFTRKTIRRIEITTEDDLICADLVEQTVRSLKQPEGISFDKERDGFQKKELEFFLDILEGKAENTNGIAHALNVLAIAEGKGLK